MTRHTLVARCLMRSLAALSLLGVCSLGSCSKEERVPKETSSTTPATEETGSTPSTTPESSTPVTDPLKEEEKRCGFPEEGTGTSPEAGEADRIYGQTVYAKHSYRVVDGRIYDRGAEIRLKGINWFGLDTPDLALHGLWSGYSRQDYLERIVDLQFNAIRLPLAPESIEDGNEVAPWAYEAGAATGRQHLERFLAEARDLGLYVLLDVHTCSADAGSRVGDPFECEGYDQTRWLNNLASLAELAGEYPNVVGIDLFNEPHALTWTQWRQLVAAGAERVLRTNPNILVFVEGVGGASYAGGYQTFWGENLCLAGRHPVAVPPRRLAYSPHVYGPSVAWHSYFDPPSFPGSLRVVWERRFGYLVDGRPALVVGEFGAPQEGVNAVWQTTFVDYLIDRDIQHFFYWSLNPNSDDTGGLLLDDWWTLDEAKYDAIRPLLERM